MHFNQLKLFYGNLETLREEENVYKMDNPGDVVVEYRPVHNIIRTKMRQMNEEEDRGVPTGLLVKLNQ